MIKRLSGILCGLLLAAPPVWALQAPAGQGGFEPAENFAAEQLPAAPLLIAAYAFVWIAVFVYVWLIWRRLSRVERDMQTLQQRQAQRTGSR